LNCWICAKVADTREHKFKKSDLIRSSTTWAPDDLPYFIGSGGRRRIPSANSRLATFGKVLCGDCNSARTQPFDRAYEAFSTWVNNAGETIMTMDKLDFTVIYGPNFQPSVLDLQKYFLKHFGCKLASDHYHIPAGLAPSLWTEELKPFEISFARSRLLGDLPARGPGVLGNYPTFGRYSPTSHEVYGPYITGTIVGYLDVIIRYDFADRFAWEGDPVDHHSAQVRLGLYEGSDSGGHLTDGNLPDSGASREFEIGDSKIKLPILTPDHMEYVLSLDRPQAGMTFEQDIDCRLKISHAILSPLFPEMTVQFLEENLSIPDTDKLWRLVFPAKD
jgi:hypothetical protein